MRKPHLAALLIATATLSLSSAHADEAEDNGIWQGTYDCSQGETLLRLTIGPEREKQREAVFYFYPRQGAPDRSSGCFSMTGRPVPGRDGWFLFSQKKWINQPPNYVMVDLIGRIDPAGSFEGVVHGPGCGRFTLKRMSDKADFPEACIPMTQ
jgi:hypothetical protein